MRRLHAHQFDPRCFQAIRQWRHAGTQRGHGACLRCAEAHIYCASDALVKPEACGDLAKPGEDETHCGAPGGSGLLSLPRIPSVRFSPVLCYFLCRLPRNHLTRPGHSLQGELPRFQHIQLLPHQCQGSRMNGIACAGCTLRDGGRGWPPFFSTDDAACLGPFPLCGGETGFGR